MAASLMRRILGTLELLAETSSGLSLGAVAEGTGMPRSAAHRLLAELAQHGWVRVSGPGHYALTTKLVGLGFRFLSGAGVDLAQPILDRLAAASGELVRLAVVDGNRLTWVAKAQGARSGLRYDPEMGQPAPLAVTASGHAWLSTLPIDDALRIVTEAGFPKLTEFGPAAPRTVGALRRLIAAAREAGFATVTDSGAVGMAAMAAPVRVGVAPAIATVSIAGPSARLTRLRMAAMAPALLSAGAELASIAGLSDVLAASPPAMEAVR